MERCGFEIMFEGMNIHSFIVSNSYNFWRGPFVFQMHRRVNQIVIRDSQRENASRTDKFLTSRNNNINLSARRDCSSCWFGDHVVHMKIIHSRPYS